MSPDKEHEGPEGRKAALKLAFLRAHYIVFTPSGRIALKVDHYNPDIAALHTQHSCGTSALLTAYNPNAAPAAQHDNQRAQADLLRCVDALGLAWYEGENSDPFGGWAERSALIMGMSMDLAHRLAAQYGQRGFLFCRESAIPSLIMT
jgi:hypothetical protein